MDNHESAYTAEQAGDLAQRCEFLEGRVAELEQRLDKAIVLADQRSQKLEQARVDYDKLVNQLLESNKAMAALARSMEKMHMESERAVARRIQGVTRPILDKISRDEKLVTVRTELGAAVDELDDLAAGLGDGEGILQKLTPSERRIAVMVKSGMSSQQISDSLNIAIDTVKTHRRNIRRKLDLGNRKANLRRYLRDNLGRSADSQG